MEFLPISSRQSDNSIIKCVDMFAKLDINLQALTFDSVMAASKLCQALNYRDTKDQTMMYDQSRTGMRVKEDIEIRKVI